MHQKIKLNNMGLCILQLKLLILSYIVFRYYYRNILELILDHRDVKVLEPFAGTGTFISRLLESGYVNHNLYQKYKNDIFANEMILLAYYIATVNIETTYTSLQKNGKYVPFEGINYTDTIKHNGKISRG